MLPCSLDKVCESVCAAAAISTVPPFPELWPGVVTPVLEHSPVLGQAARHPRPFQSLEVTQAPGPGGQILLWDTERHVASPSPLQLALEQGRHWKGQVAHVIRRRTASVLASPTNFIRPHCLPC